MHVDGIEDCITSMLFSLRGMKHLYSIFVLVTKYALLLCSKSCWAAASPTPAAFVKVPSKGWPSTRSTHDSKSSSRMLRTWDKRCRNRNLLNQSSMPVMLKMNGVVQQGGDNDASGAISYPPPKVWTLSKASRNLDNEGLSLQWNELSLVKDGQKLQNVTKNQDASFLSKMAIETWNWCKDFVVPLKLCPWAKTSLETPRALQLFLVSEKDAEYFVCGQGQNGFNDLCARIIQDVAAEFQDLLQEQPSFSSNAIFFVVFVPSVAFYEDGSNSDVNWAMNSFEGFYDWYVDLEDWWTSDEENDPITLAPFHPLWVFEGDGDDGFIGDETDGDESDKEKCNDHWKQLEFEKKSPYPIVTIVSSASIDQAGPVVTEQIGKTNYETLTSWSVQQLDKLWTERIFQE